MASSNPSRQESQIVDALSCIICFTPYDATSRVPKAFSCLHTVCLACAEQLCQQADGSTFPCPTCRQPVSIPSQGASGLPTNLDVRNVVEIIQKTSACSTSHPNCPVHQSKSITNVCMECEVGMCSRCFASSSMKEHSSHELLDLEDALENIKARIDSVTEKAKKACQLLNAESQVIQEKKVTIESCTTELASAYVSKNLGMFGLLRELSALLVTSASTETQNLECSTEHISDDNCTAESLKWALDGLSHGMSLMQTSKGANTEHSIACQKLAAVTILVDLLRMKQHHQLSKLKDKRDTFRYLYELCDKSEACCHRVVLLGGADLLMSCFEASMTNEKICLWVVAVYGMLAEYPVLHTNLVSSKAVNMLVYMIHNFTEHFDYACKPLSFFLCNVNVTWPDQCLSREEISALVVDNYKCKKLSLSKKDSGSCISFRTHVSLLSQNVSEAAKYWPACSLYMHIDQHPDVYCPMLVRDGGITVLKQQGHAHEYVQRLAKSVLRKFKDYNS